MMSTETEKSIYLRRRTEELQNAVVNVKCSTTSTTDAFIWTLKATSSEVISVVTTTVPLKNGTMKEMTKTRNKEMRRIKCPTRKPGTFLSMHPFEEKFLHNENAVRLRKNEALWLEHKSFFKKLLISRHLKSTVESIASTYIQKIYRGFCIRTRKDEITESCLFRKRIRSQIRDYIITHTDNRGIGIILTQGEHRKRYKEWRYRAASSIQRGYRCFYSRTLVRKVRTEMIGIKEARAVIKIQSFTRRIAAVRRTSSLKYNRLEYMRTKAVVLVQSLFRYFLAKRRVSKRRYRLHNIAARIIQCCYRCHRAKTLFKFMDRKFLTFYNNDSIIAIQCLVRKKISCVRVKRLNEIRLIHRRNYHSSRIQAIMRGYLTRNCLNRVRADKTEVEKRMKKQTNLDYVNSIIVKSNKPKKLLITHGKNADELDISRHEGNHTIEVCPTFISI